MTKAYAVRFGPAGVHLFDRQNGTNILCDELKVAPKHWSRAPRQISIALTNLCDLKCKFCYAPKNVATLDSSTVCRWLTELSDHGCLGIGFGGGEPTLHPALPFICEFATRSTQLAVTLTTHGHRISDLLAGQLQGNVNFVRVSVDGVDTSYESIRGRSFPELRDKLKLVRSISAFGINCVINRMTVGQLDKLAEFAANEGAAELLLLPQRRTNAVMNVDRSTIDRLRDWIESYRGPVPLSISEESSAGLPIHMDSARETAIRSFVHLNAEGYLKRSSYDTWGVFVGQKSILDSFDNLIQEID